MSILAKWKWHILQEDPPLWKVVLREKYGDDISGFTPEDGNRWPQITSGWWRELMSLERGVGVKWFTDRAVRKISNGRGTSFWKDRWIGEQPLAPLFPRIYSISSQKEATVGDLWNGEETPVPLGE